MEWLLDNWFWFGLGLVFVAFCLFIYRSYTGGRGSHGASPGGGCCGHGSHESARGNRPARGSSRGTAL